MIYVLLSLLLLFGCSPGALEDYQYQGELLCRALVRDLQRIETREDLSRLLPDLQKKFIALVELMIEAKQFQQKHPQEVGMDPAYFEHEYAEGLKEELARICQLEGGRELIEKAQRESLILLDRALSRK